MKGSAASQSVGFCEAEQGTVSASPRGLASWVFPGDTTFRLVVLLGVERDLHGILGLRRDFA